MIMIDWLSSTIQTPDTVYTGTRCTNTRLERTPDGEIIKEYRIGQHITFDNDNEPSHSRNVYVHTPDAHTLRINGNPSKFLQGHNLFGSGDLIGLYFETGCLIRRSTGLFPSVDSFDSCGFGAPAFSRMDITRSYRFSTLAEAQEFIRYVAGTARTRHGAAKLYGSETAYFGQGSRRWSFKIYDKLSEYRKSTNRRELDDELMDWARGIVRFELCLRGQELKTINHGLRLRATVHYDDIWQSYFNRIQFNENAAMTTENIIQNYDSLSDTQKGFYLRWKNGEDLRQSLTKTTYYRVRQGILKAVGVDIATPPNATPTSDCKPVKTCLDASGWDPQPLEHRMIKPRDDLKKAYGF